MRETSHPWNIQDHSQGPEQKFGELGQQIQETVNQLGQVKIVRMKLAEHIILQRYHTVDQFEGAHMAGVEL